MIFVCTPGGATTGGPEACHQLVDALRSHGIDAFISYFPAETKFECPIVYSHYDSPQAPVWDDPSSLVLVPEGFVELLSEFRFARKAVWWLSVDNYLGRRRESVFRDFVNWARKRRSGGILPNRELRQLQHYCQSHYAVRFLRRKGIHAPLLSDYLAAQHLAIPSQNQRANRLALNPAKGTRAASKLVRGELRDRAVLLQGMTPEQVREALESVKIYVDLGHHPGKDRFPREAAMAGACVLTSKSGSAAFQEDVPIPDRYRFRVGRLALIWPGVRLRFQSVVQSVFDDFDSASSDFEAYRSWIARERDVFFAQVEDCFAAERHP